MQSICLTIVQIVFKVIYCPKDVQLICLSATVANPDELAGWIGQVIMFFFFFFFVCGK